MALKKCKECGSEISKKAKSCPKCGSPQKRSTSTITWIVGGLFALVVMNMVFISDGDDNKSDTSTAKPAEDRAPSAYEAVSLEDISFSIESGAFLLNGQLKNANAFPVGDILVRCTTYGQTNTALNRLDQTVRKIIPSGEALKISKLNMGISDAQTSRASCRVVHVNSAK